MYKLLGVLQGRVRVCRNTPEGEIDTRRKKMWIITSCAESRVHQQRKAGLIEGAAARHFAAGGRKYGINSLFGRQKISTEAAACPSCGTPTKAGTAAKSQKFVVLDASAKAVQSLK
jgi:hypothetical protein